MQREKLSFYEIIKEIELDYKTKLFKDLSNKRPSSANSAFFENDMLLTLGYNLKLESDQYHIASLYFDNKEEVKKYENMKKMKDFSIFQHLYFSCDQREQKYVAYYKGPQTNFEKLTMYETNSFKGLKADDELEFYSMISGDTEDFNGTYGEFKKLVKSNFEGDFNNYLEIINK